MTNNNYICKYNNLFVLVFLLFFTPQKEIIKKIIEILILETSFQAVYIIIAFSIAKKHNQY